MNQVRSLVEKGTDNLSDALDVAIENGHWEIVKYLAQEEANRVARDRDGVPPLHWAAEKGRLEIVQHLVQEERANKNELVLYNRTPLHLAAWNGHLNVVQYLVEQGANKKAVDTSGNTPLALALSAHHSGVVEYLQGTTRK